MGREAHSSVETSQRLVIDRDGFGAARCAEFPEYCGGMTPDGGHRDTQALADLGARETVGEQFEKLALPLRQMRSACGECRFDLLPAAAPPKLGNQIRNEGSR